MLRIAVLVSGGGTNLQAIIDRLDQAEYLVITGKGENRTFFSNTPATIYCVSSQCENPEVLIKLMNLSVQKLCYPESEEEFYKYYGDMEHTGWKAGLTQTLEPLKNYDNYQKESAALESGDTSELNTEQLGDYNNMKA